MADRFTFTKSHGESGQYLPHPEGQAAAVCVDFIDLGEKATEWKGKPKVAYKVAFVFATGALKEDGTLHTVTKEVTASLHENATLRKFLEEWRGKSFTEADIAKGIPADKFVGAACLFVVEHAKSASGDRIYANIKSIQMLPKGMTKPEVTGYTRAPYWAEKKATYAQGAAAFHAAHDKREESFDDFPEALAERDDDLSDLPF